MCKCAVINKVLIFVKTLLMTAHPRYISIYERQLAKRSQAHVGYLYLLDILLQELFKLV